MTYGSAHRFLLRTVASRGVLSVLEAQKVLDKHNESSEFVVQDMVKQINDTIRPYQQQIKLTNDEVTDEEVIVFLSLGYDDATKSQNVFSTTELEYFRVLIEQIMSTEARQITGINAINLVGKMKSTFTKTDAQKLLNTWCRMRYLDKEESNYALGVRAIHEFEGYLRQNMPDTIEECCLCKQIVFRGYNCPACALAVHTRCLRKYLEKVEKWPCCKVDFKAEQLEMLNCQSLTQTQVDFNATQQSVTYTTVGNTIADSEAQPTDDVEMTQELIPEISQRVTLKRKRQKE